MKRLLFLSTILFLIVSTSYSAFTVRVIYFQPSDVDNPKMQEKISETIKDVQTFYADEMTRHGYGNKTFRIEKDKDDKVVVHLVKGKKTSAEYISDRTYASIKPEIPAQFINLNNIHVIFVGGHARVNKTLLGIGVATFGSVDGGYAILPTDNFIFRVIAHEIGHTFGLQHNISDKPDYLMGLDSGFDGLAHYEARWLDKHHYFNPVRPINFVPKVTRVHAIQRIPNNRIRFTMDVESINKLHQAEIARFSDVGIVSTNYLKGNLKEIVSFEFPIVDLMGNRSVWMRVMDQKGNYWMQHASIYIPLPVNKNPEIDDPKEEQEKEINETEEPVKEKHPLKISVKNKHITLWAYLKKR